MVKTGGHEAVSTTSQVGGAKGKERRFRLYDGGTIPRPGTHRESQDAHSGFSSANREANAQWNPLAKRAVN